VITGPTEKNDNDSSDDMKSFDDMKISLLLVCYHCHSNSYLATA